MRFTPSHHKHTSIWVSERIMHTQFTRNSSRRRNTLVAVIAIGIIAILLIGAPHATTPLTLNPSLPPELTPLPKETSTPRTDQVASDPAQTVDTSPFSVQADQNLLKTDSRNADLDDTNSTIVRFASANAKQQFLETNNLSETDLVAIPRLQAYQITTKNILPTDGSILYQNQAYQALLTPTDPQASGQWHFSKINAPLAWNHQTGLPSTVIAVIDGGFGLNHQELSSQWAYNANETGSTNNEGVAPNCTSRSLTLDKRCNNIDDDGDGYVDNYLGWDFTGDVNDVSAGKTAPNDPGADHATIVASLAAGQTNNGVGGAGVSWNTRILPIQALDDTGSGTTLTVALGIRYAVDHGAKVINMSLGAAVDDPVVAEQVTYALDHGVTVVAAAGNDGCNCLSYPARYPGVIAVGATTSSDARASFSNVGTQLDLVAPGYNVCSSLWTPLTPTNGYSCGLAGTSFSSPLVAGAAGLLLSQNPSLTPAQVSNALTASATKLPLMNGANFTTSYGYGQLNILGALSLISLPTPTGKPLSTGVIIQSQLSSPTTFVTDSMNSACRSTEVGATCRLRAINTTTNQVVILAESSEPGVTNLPSQITAANLAAGDWIMQAAITKNSVWSLARESALRVVP